MWAMSQNLYSEWEPEKTHANAQTTTPYKCEQCPQDITWNLKLMQYIRTHTGERLCRREQCPQAFSRKDGLTKRIQLHMAETLEMWAMSQDLYAEWEPENAHVNAQKTTDLTNASSVPMSLLGTWSWHSILDKHAGEKPYKCKQCPQSFSRNENLMQHIRTQAGKRSYKC